MKRIITYVDGFNLYYGMKSKGWKRYYWLNVRALAQGLLKPDQRLVQVKYFTSYVSATPEDPKKNKRQSTYVDALRTLQDVQIVLGHYLEKPVRCRKCGARWKVPEEKMTDVNIATALLEDAFEDRFDTALLISGDSDLTGPVQSIRRRFRDKRIIVAFPPGRSSVRLSQVASACFTIGRKKLAESQFPDGVTKADGYVLRRPDSWS